MSSFRKIYRDFSLDEIIRFRLANDEEACGLSFYTIDQLHYLALMDLLVDDHMPWWTWQDELHKLGKLNGILIGGETLRHIETLYGEEFYDWIRENILIKLRC